MGFFYKTPDKATTRPAARKGAGKGKTPSSRTKASQTCPCGLEGGCITPYMPISGQGRKGIFILAEAPGEQEDIKGVQLIGQAGQRLRKELASVGIDLDRDCWKMNAVNCRPPKNRPPVDKEIAACRPRVWTELERLNPFLIILLGNPAIKSVIGNRWKKDLGGINKWRGWTIPDRQLRAWVCPTFHPSYIMRMENSKQTAATTIWHQDLENAAAHVDKALPNFPDEHTLVRVAKTPAEVEDALAELRPTRGCLLSHDFETTGLKPYVPGHRIACASFYTGEGKAIAVPVHHRDYDRRDIVIPYMKRWLSNPAIKKTAHNLKFELAWTREALDIHTRGWEWCSMNAAHVLDNREGITSLKFQAYVRYGVIDYDSHIETFLDSKSKDANAFNTVDDAPIDDLLLYCGQDSVFGHWLATDQQQEIEHQRLDDAYDLIHNGLLTLAKIEGKGISVDTEYCARNVLHNVQRVVPRLDEELLNSKLGKAWQQVYGDKLNLNSSAQLRVVLFDHLGLDPTNHTDKGAAKVDQGSLEDVSLDGVDKYLERGKLGKNLSYLEGLMREAPDGWLHTFFNLHTVGSYRSSSNAINFQNMPNRDAKANKLIRTAIRPRPGRRIVCIDYGGIEVKVSACVHKDPAMIKYVEDESTDMHRDTAMELFLLPIQEVEKWIRYYAKNQFVFPQFYGDWWVSCAKSLWKMIDRMNLKTVSGQLLKDHLREQGIKELGTLDKKNHPSRGSFYAHVRDVEDRFWNERFKVYADWKKRHMATYSKRGYFDMLTGFRCGGVMTRNEALNLPIQGPAFHCLLWSLIQMQRIAEREQWESDIIGQIHDEMVIDAVPEEIPMIAHHAERIMTKAIREHWNWIIVPLVVEIEATGIDEPWHKKSKLEL